MDSSSVKGFIPDKDFIADASAAPADSSGFISDSNFISDEEKYGDPLSQLKSAGLGAARSATFGLSDEAITRLGLLTPEELTAYKEQNPVATTIGEVGGVAGSLLAPEVGLLGAISAPVKGVAKLGQAVTKAAAIPATTTAGKIAAQAAALGAGSAVEGAVYGLGKSISEHALGDPDLNAEKVVSNIGTGFLLGGVLGSALGATEAAIPAAVNSAKQAFSKLYDASIGLPGKEPGLLGKAYAQSASFVSGKPYDQIVEAMQNRMSSLVKPEEQKEVISQFSNSLKDQHDKINRALFETNKNARLQETANYLKDVPGDVAIPEMEKSVFRIKNAIREMREEPDLYPGSYPRILEQINDRVSKEITQESTAFDVFKSLDGLKKRLDEEIQYGAAPSGGDLRAQNKIGEIRKFIKDSLEESSIWGEAASRQAQFNDAQAQFLNLVGKKGLFREGFMGKSLGKGGKLTYEVSPSKVETYLRQINSLRGETKTEALKHYLEVSDNLLGQIEKSYQTLPDKAFSKESIQSVIDKNKGISQKAIEQAEIQKTFNALGAGAHNAPLFEGAAASTGLLGHPLAAAALESVAMAKAPGLAIQRLAKIERVIQEMDRSISKGVSAIFNTSSKSAERLVGYASSRLDTEQKEKKFKKVSAQLNELTNDPEKLISNLEKSTQNIHTDAPKISQGLQMTASRAAQFLQSKIPGNNIQKAPLSDPYEPSDAELSKWQKYFSVVEDPTSALKQVAQGTLTKETMETLKVVYPKLLKDMQQQVTDRMVDAIVKKKPIPYKTKLTLSLFLGQDLVSSLDSKTILANQNMLATATQAKDLREGAQMLRANKGAVGKMKESNRLLTPMQEAAQRKDS